MISTTRPREATTRTKQPPSELASGLGSKLWAGRRVFPFLPRRAWLFMPIFLFSGMHFSPADFVLVSTWKPSGARSQLRRIKAKPGASGPTGSYIHGAVSKWMPSCAVAIELKLPLFSSHYCGTCVRSSYATRDGEGSGKARGVRPVARRGGMAAWLVC